jgi:hypothetical protein
MKVAPNRLRLCSGLRAHGLLRQGWKLRLENRRMQWIA